MEQAPQNNMEEPPFRPRFEVDLSTAEGMPFKIVARAVQLLKGDQLLRFSLTVWLASQQGSGATYNDFLKIVNDYTEVIDPSGTFGAYAPDSPDAQP